MTRIHHHKASVSGFLPVTEKELRSKGWDHPDIILITGDAYVDHPSYGTAIIGRVLEAAGFRVGIIAQPDWRTTRDFQRLGKPRLFFGITAGNLDSMVANYTSTKRPRKKDDYSPGGAPGLRPDRATIVYANRVREAYSDVPIVIGGIEASLRRFAHYDWWDNQVRRSILVDSRADILVYGMGERQIAEIAERIRDHRELAGIRGTAIRQSIVDSSQSSVDPRQGKDNRQSIVDSRQSSADPRQDRDNRQSIVDSRQSSVDPRQGKDNRQSIVDGSQSSVDPRQGKDNRQSIVDSRQSSADPRQDRDNRQSIVDGSQSSAFSGFNNVERRTLNVEHDSRLSTIDYLLSTAVEIPSYEEVKEDRDKFNEAFRTISSNQDPFSGKTIIQKHGTHYVIQFPPPFPESTHELDSIYSLPYQKAWHPSYDTQGGVPGFETVRFSIVSHRGCCGDCSFCALSMHQGRIVRSRSKRSILEEAKALTESKDFHGTIADIGGPTANLYQAHCAQWEDKGACSTRNCLVPDMCKGLQPGYKESIDLLREVIRLPKVKHVFIESGLRHDLLVRNDAAEYLQYICAHHISGRMKVAPEHCVEHVLKIMNKPSFRIYEQFVKRFDEAKRKTGKEFYLVNYFISAHPGATLSDSLELARYLKKRNIHPEQIQDFMPLPLTLSGTIYYTEKDPYTGRRVYVAKTFRERKMQRALIQYNNPKNRPLIREAMRLLQQDYV
ncbi:MAG: hypothetical protein A4E64_02182 [Syntrophorhabdus sp. PtaU1.Bin058]|nr:MAG: hypothetical protein A4E64_02182 [Syntrophorhabdus sp. PtaU1.Bin058]